jgi:5-methylcytosine-specific restriction protein B
MARHPDLAPALQAAEYWRDRCLRRPGSVFTDRELWTAENLDHLVRHFVENLDEGKDSFLDKLRRQLAPVPPGAKQLAAEMLWVMFLFPTSNAMKPGTKRLQVRQVWEWSGEALPHDELLIDQALERGMGNPGSAFHTHRWREFAFFIRLVRAWRDLAEEEQRRLLADGWVMADWIDGQPIAKNRLLRHILLFLLFPDEFERITSMSYKRRIIRAFRKHLGDDPEAVDDRRPTAVDRELLRIRRLMEERHPGQDLVFWLPPLRDIWMREQDDDGKDGLGDNAQPLSSSHELDAWYRDRFGDARVWAIGTGIGGRLWPDFRDGGIAALGFDALGDLAEYMSREEVHEALVRETGGDATLTTTARAAWEFAHEMRTDDIVIAKGGRGTLLGWGIVASDYVFDTDRDEYPHVRRVEWKLTGEWDLPEGQRTTSAILADISLHKGWLRYAFELMERGAIPPEPESSYTVDDALDGVFLPRDQFQDILDLLGRKKNVILEGPPGVGKTFIAKRIAWALMRQKDPRRLEMVQFHQSYAYEDFVQGWRPAETGGFTLRNGVFYEFCERAARDDPERPYVFIIDEINRGNLSKVFGELLMLIEADKRGPGYAIPLTYSRVGDERFYVPRNVYILGMMNTADRSLAMVDYALRRRFAFVRLEPAFGSERFTDYLLGAGVDEAIVERICTRMEELNREIRNDTNNLGPGFEIGHSYFVPDARADEVLDHRWYEAVIRAEIEPLLREYWFDQPQRVAEAVERLLA